MAERPPILAVGRISRVHDPARLYGVRMENGYEAYAILERKGPLPEGGVDQEGNEVLVKFSPFDMSRCKIAEWKGKG